jgi:hypothetical protein
MKQYDDSDDFMAKVLSTRSDGSAGASHITSKPKKRAKIVFASLALFILVGAGGGALYVNSQKIPVTPISQYSKELQFKIYYPKELPEGYTLQENSVRVEDNILFYTITSDAKKMYVSQQTLPDPIPTIDNVEGNTAVITLDTEYGHAVVGTVKGIPIGIMTTDTTLVNVNLSVADTKDAARDLFQNLSLVE